FQTAFTVAAQSIAAAQVEAQSAINGVGLVQLMGRHAGFIACYAALANHHADFVLIPEVPFALDGESGFLAALERRVAERGSAVVVVAEGAGQDLMTDAQTGTDASGNRKLGDIGRFLEAAIIDHYNSIDRELTLKFLKPGYSIRSVPAKAHDSVYCVRLAQAAAHAGMAGRTDMVVGRRHNRFVHVPIDIVVSERNEVAPDGDLWLSVLESTAQPLEMR
ncbi:MAG: 6-phosphofructokinase, partial [Nakamurella sp.]